MTRLTAVTSPPHFRTERQACVDPAASSPPAANRSPHARQGNGHHRLGPGRVASDAARTRPPPSALKTTSGADPHEPQQRRRRRSAAHDTFRGFAFAGARFYLHPAGRRAATVAAGTMRNLPDGDRAVLPHDLCDLFVWRLEHLVQLRTRPRSTGFQGVSSTVSRAMDDSFSASTASSAMSGPVRKTAGTSH